MSDDTWTPKTGIEAMFLEEEKRVERINKELQALRKLAAAARILGCTCAAGEGRPGISSHLTQCDALLSALAELDALGVK